MTTATQDSPQRRAVARYLMAADNLYRRAAEIVDGANYSMARVDEYLDLIEAANIATRSARDELVCVPWVKE